MLTSPQLRPRSDGPSWYRRYEVSLLLLETEPDGWMGSGERVRVAASWKRLLPLRRADESPSLFYLEATDDIMEYCTRSKDCGVAGTTPGHWLAPNKTHSPPSLCFKKRGKSCEAVPARVAAEGSGLYGTIVLETCFAEDSSRRKAVTLDGMSDCAARYTASKEAELSRFTACKTQGGSRPLVVGWPRRETTSNLARQDVALPDDSWPASWF